MSDQEKDLRALDFSIRLNRVLNEMDWPLRGRSPKLRAELAKRGIDVSVTATTRWLSGLYGPDKEKLKVISEITGKSIDYFVTGCDFYEPSTSSAYSVSESAHGGYRARSIPVISWEDAFILFKTKTAPSPDIILDFIASTTKVSEKAFALIYSDDSMTSMTNIRSYPPGAFVIFDPEKEQEPPCRVLAVIGEQCIFRELVSDAGELVLRPLNQQYRTISIPDKSSIFAVSCGYSVRE